MRSNSYEIKCEVCEAIVARDQSRSGTPIINRGEICVDLNGEVVEASRLSALRPELARLPKMRLCHNHLKEQRRKDGGEWVTITEAAAMLARRDKRESQDVVAQEDVGGSSRAVSKIMENLGVGDGANNPYIMLRKLRGK